MFDFINLMIFSIVLLVIYSFVLFSKWKKRIVAKKLEDLRLEQIRLEAEKELEIMKSLDEFSPYVNKLLEETNYSPEVRKKKSEKERYPLFGVAVLAGLFAVLYAFNKPKK